VYSRLRIAKRTSLGRAVEQALAAGGREAVQPICCEVEGTEGWGIARLHELLQVVYAAVKKAKADALVITQKPHPSFAEPVTLADIAREAGTSASTASRALSGRGYVSPDARARLLAAAERLGYVPNASARTLKQRTSRIVGVVVSDLRNQFYARLAAGIEQTLREADFQMVLLVDRQLAGGTCDAVVIDNERGARDATRHLLDLGHRRVALLVVKSDWESDVGRLRGYRAAYSEAGIPVDGRLIVRIPLHAPDTAERIGVMLSRESPTAIFAANNLLAAGAWSVLRDRGKRLPRDVSLVGFDDVSWMEMVDPGITVVAQPTLEMGRTAARLLLERIADPTREPVVERLETTLVVRGSTAAPSH
jgi:LacI family transcriptional regulator